jgi:hypothetical protein
MALNTIVAFRTIVSFAYSLGCPADASSLMWRKHAFGIFFCSRVTFPILFMMHSDLAL